MHIVMTGGGTAGHVVPNLAIVDAIRDLTKAKKHKLKLSYIGSKYGIEQKLIKEEGIRFYAVSTGKMRRYFDLRNIIDLFKIPVGIIQAWILIGKLKPDLVFSKGGFVAFPVVVGSWMRGVKVIIHESDANAGLTTKLCAPFAKKIILAFSEAEEGLTKYRGKIQVLGVPIRKNIYKGSKSRAEKLTGFSGEKPVLLVLGGSGGSKQINDMIEKEKDQITKAYDIIHITGKNKDVGPSNKNDSHYFSMEFAGEEMKDFYALASLALSRAGSTVLAELSALEIPTLLYPLGLSQSRGDQILNAFSVAGRYGFFRVANPNKPAFNQLVELPKRSGNTKENYCAQDIAKLLMNS